MALTDEQKERIRADFREYSGGFDANEAGDELEVYIEIQNWPNDGTMDDDEVEAFLLEWAEEPHT